MLPEALALRGLRFEKCCIRLSRFVLLGFDLYRYFPGFGYAFRAWLFGA